MSLNQIEFFNGYWPYLEGQGVKSVILHSWQDYPEAIASDVDYCVSQGDINRVIPLLHEYCEQSGWSLCQIFQHEKTAYFCICVSNENPKELVMLDVCGDYTVRGVRRVASDVFIEKRVFNEAKGFWVLNAEAELVYILIKAAAKNKDPQTVIQRIDELLYEMSSEALSNVARYLPEQNLLKSQQLFQNPSRYLKESVWSKFVGMSSGASCFEFIRKVKRVIHPTGFHIEVRSSDSDDVLDGGRKLMHSLRETCRNVLLNDLRQDNRRGLIRKGLYLAKIKSTLVVSVSKSGGKSLFNWVDYSLELPEDWKQMSDQEGFVNQQALHVIKMMAARTRKRWLSSGYKLK